MSIHIHRLGYLDFGEMCTDKVVDFFRRNISEKDKAEYREYVREQENRRNCNRQPYREYHQDPLNRRDSVVC